MAKVKCSGCGWGLRSTFTSYFLRHEVCQENNSPGNLSAAGASHPGETISLGVGGAIIRISCFGPVVKEKSEVALCR